MPIAYAVGFCLSMEKIIFSNAFFNIEDTLNCGQIFRFSPYKLGYLVFSRDKCAYVYTSGENTIIECEKCDKDYFYNYFDLSKDYSQIVFDAISTKVDILSKSATIGKGIRILNQDKFEIFISFIISQNNNIPRIKGIIEKMCTAIGEKKVFGDISYYTFPSLQALNSQSIDFFKEIGLGYRAEYVYAFVKDVFEGKINMDFLSTLSTSQLKKQLQAIYGIGPKVADCITLFAYHRGDSFPVDTWIYKVYTEDFNGKLLNRDKVSEWFVNSFGENAGYYQQYLFYYKRSKENNFKS